MKKNTHRQDKHALNETGALTITDGKIYEIEIEREEDKKRVTQNDRKESKR